MFFLLLRICISLFMIVPFTYRAWNTVPFCIIVNISFPLLWLYISFLMKYIVIKKALYDYLTLKNSIYAMKQHALSVVLHIT